MADRYVDSNTGSDSDNGTTQALAWATLEHALGAGSLGVGDKVWIRRTHGETPTVDIASLYDGSASQPLELIGWPRPAILNTTITQADFTNGSKIIDNVVGITPDREKHTGRYITAPDGKRYLITAVLWEADVDGMGSGDEFTVGSALTNVTQTKKGRLFAFTDNLDTTGTIQYVRDSSSAWVDNDNITDADGGDAEIDSGGETAVGFVIEREYVGGTVTGTDGKFQIDEDEDYDDRPTDIDGWDSDAIDLPVIDFNDTDYRVYVYYNDAFHVFKNIEFKDSADAGMLGISGGGDHSIIGCLLKQTTQNQVLITTSYCTLTVKRCIFEGLGTGAFQRGITVAAGTCIIEDSAMFNMGDHAVFMRYCSQLRLKNVNMGVEIENGDGDIGFDSSPSSGGPSVYGLDAELGGNNGEISIGTALSSNLIVRMENYGKQLGSHKMWFPGGTQELAAVSGENPNKKLSDNVIKLTLDQSGYEYQEDWAVEVFCHEFEVDAISRNYKYWIYNDLGATLNDVTAKDNIWLEAEYVSAYEDDSEYLITKKYSTEIDILDATGADDWDYLEVPSVAPAVASKVRVRCFISKYSSGGNVFIDPEVVIS